MSIVYPLEIPSTKSPAKVTIIKNQIVGQTTSPFTAKQKQQKRIGEWWEAEVTLPEMDLEECAKWRAFILSLDGVIGTFLLKDYLARKPFGVARNIVSNPQVSGIGQTGQSLNISNCPIDTVGYLKAGSSIQLGSGLSSRLHVVLQDVDIDGSGNASMFLWPKIRNADAPIDGSNIILNDAKGLFRLKSNTQDFPIDVGGFSGFSFSCREALE